MRSRGEKLSRRRKIDGKFSQAEISVCNDFFDRISNRRNMNHRTIPVPRKDRVDAAPATRFEIPSRPRTFTTAHHVHVHRLARSLARQHRALRSRVCAGERMSSTRRHIQRTRKMKATAATTVTTRLTRTYRMLPERRASQLRIRALTFLRAPSAVVDALFHARGTATPVSRALARIPRWKQRRDSGHPASPRARDSPLIILARSISFVHATALYPA